MFDVCLINSYLVFSFWFLRFAFFYDNVTAIRCIWIREHEITKLKNIYIFASIPEKKDTKTNTKRHE